MGAASLSCSLPSPASLLLTEAHSPSCREKSDHARLAALKKLEETQQTSTNLLGEGHCAG